MLGAHTSQRMIRPVYWLRGVLSSYLVSKKRQGLSTKTDGESQAVAEEIRYVGNFSITYTVTML